MTSNSDKHEEAQARMERVKTRLALYNAVKVLLKVAKTAKRWGVNCDSEINTGEQALSMARGE